MSDLEALNFSYRLMQKIQIHYAKEELEYRLKWNKKLKQ